ncbi:uncharacterized protein VP01_7543g1, partial [Puccinia sorghi]
FTRLIGCPFSCSAYFQKKQGIWKFSVSNPSHNNYPAALSSLSHSLATAGADRSTIVTECVAKCERAVLICCFQSEVMLSREEARALL